MLTVVGALLIMVAMRDVRLELFHPQRTGTLSRLVSRIVWSVVRTSAQLQQARITCYFQNEDEDRALTSTLPDVPALARAAEGGDAEPAIGQLATRLRMAIEDLLCDIGEAHLGARMTPDRVLEALARDHLREAPSSM